MKLEKGNMGHFGSFFVGSTLALVITFYSKIEELFIEMGNTIFNINVREENVLLVSWSYNPNRNSVDLFSFQKNHILVSLKKPF